MDNRYRIMILPFDGPEGHWMWVVQELVRVGVWDECLDGFGYASTSQLAAIEAESWYRMHIEHHDIITEIEQLLHSHVPSDCFDCLLHDHENGNCKLLHRTTLDTPPYDCPLVIENMRMHNSKTEIHAHWKRLINIHGLLSGYCCSHCRYEEGSSTLVSYKHCPYCGAIMVQTKDIEV